MIAEKEDETSVGKVVAANWLPVGSEPQVYIDEASLSYVGDRIYLTLGQIQAPLPGQAAPPEVIEILPLVRVVMTETAFHKIAGLLQQVRGQITNPATTKGKQ